MTWEQVETVLIVWALAGVSVCALFGLRPFLDWWEEERQDRILRRQPRRHNVVDFKVRVLSAASMGREARPK